MKTSILLALVLLPFAALAEQDDFDRLDGTGASGKRVDVIEWEGNLEVHVYPKGSLKGLALKLDEKNKDKPVMVIGYRFDNAPKSQLIRRAILGIKLKEPLKTFRDPSADDYDKIIISNNGLSGQMQAFKLDPAPAQLYPDGHPALAKTEEKRKPASKEEQRPVYAPPKVDEDGRIQPFFLDK
jgi:hypothetical protein